MFRGYYINIFLRHDMTEKITAGMNRRYGKCPREGLLKHFFSQA
jgi:hypothetical protein